MNNELKEIKKKYGEDMSHLCRELFPTILECPDLLYTLLSNSIAPTKSIAKDIINNGLQNNFSNFIYSLLNEENRTQEISDKSPFELFDEIGYTLYECSTQEDIQRFKKYYKKSEELCTFNDERLKRCFVFFAVKKDVDNIKREDFINPEREDLYGTSVISIQFTRGDINILSIKNRYNHTVENPDATFSNNLENIASGLTDSFVKYYGFNIRQNLNNVSNFFYRNLYYVIGPDHKYYRYNTEINNVFYCENNIIIKPLYNEFISEYHKEKERYIVMDYFILDLKEKKLFVIDNHIDDSFVKVVNSNKIKKIDVEKQKDVKVITIYDELGRNQLIKLNDKNSIICYKNDYIERIGSDFIYYNKCLESLSLSKVKVIKDCFLFSNKCLKELELPSVVKIGDDFISSNRYLRSFKADNLKEVRNNFLESNLSISKINFPNLTKVGYGFLSSNRYLKTFNAPLLIKVGDRFLYHNIELKYIRLNKLRNASNDFIALNPDLTGGSFYSLRKIGNNFLGFSSEIKEIELPNVKNIGNYFCYKGTNIRKVVLPRVEVIGSNFMFYNENCTKLNMNNVRIIGEYFLHMNTSLEELSLPMLKAIEANSLFFNRKMKMVYMPSVEYVGDYFLHSVEGEKVKKMIK